MQYKQLRAFVAPQAIELVTIPVSREAEVQVVTKLRDFFTPGSDDSLSDTLALSVTEINHLIRTSQSLEALHLDYHMDIQDTLLVAHNSLPVDRLNGLLSLLAKTLHVKGFLNSEMRGYVSLTKDGVNIVPVSATMNGVAAPISVLNRKGGIDPSEWIADRDFYRRCLARLSGIAIRNGSLLFIKRP